jgi:hypothetical protein
MDLIEQMEAVRWFQQRTHIHPLTCRQNSNHDLLVPAVKGEDAVLVCPTCGFLQEHIPSFVFDAWARREEFEESERHINQMLEGIHNAATQAPVRRRDAGT